MKHGKRILLLTGSIIFWAGAGRMTVHAEPATLQSASAVVYEQMDEAGNAVANLIQDGSFELLGSATAEDGSTWYAIATENGVQGYIKGDTAINLASAEAPQETEPPENPPVQEPGEGAGEEPAGAAEEAPAEEPPAEAEGEPEEAGEEPQEEGAEEAEEDPEEEEGTGEIEFPDRMENTQEKTYAINAGEVKIKSRETSAESTENPAEKTEKLSFKTLLQRVDKALLIFILAFAGVLAAAGVSYRKMRQEKEGSREAEKGLPDKPDKKKSRKSVRRKKKSKRKKRGKNGHAGNRSYK